MKTLNSHSTRLFPKDLGADRYEITGIAGKCDWVVLSDCREPHIHVHKVVECPRSIFLSMRAHLTALEYFAREVLPTLQHPFVLISGSEDITLPLQVDRRWPVLSDRARQNVDIIVNHPLVTRWVVENLDNDSHPKFAPMPCGLLFSDAPNVRNEISVPSVPKISDRPMRVLCSHRVRKGVQWDMRRRVTAIAKNHWSAWCLTPEPEMPEPEYFRLMEEAAFVLCVKGGGIDPSPKAWQAILHGAIPIIRKNSLFSAYRQLPVVFVDDWSPDCLSMDKLHDWRSQLCQHYDVEEERHETLRKLGLDYWFAYAMGR